MCILLADWSRILLGFCQGPLDLTSKDDDI